MQVINAYMSLLSTRNMMRHFKHEQELAIVAESDVGEGSKPRTRRSSAIKNSSEHAESRSFYNQQRFHNGKRMREAASSAAVGAAADGVRAAGGVGAARGVGTGGGAAAKTPSPPKSPPPDLPQGIKLSLRDVHLLHANGADVLQQVATLLSTQPYGPDPQMGILEAYDELEKSCADLATQFGMDAVKVRLLHANGADVLQQVATWLSTQPYGPDPQMGILEAYDELEKSCADLATQFGMDAVKVRQWFILFHFWTSVRQTWSVWNSTPEVERDDNIEEAISAAMQATRFSYENVVGFFSWNFHAENLAASVLALVSASGGRAAGGGTAGGSEDGGSDVASARIGGPLAPVSSNFMRSTAPLKCVFFSSFFYAILCNAKGGYNFQSVRRWSRKKVCGCVYAGELVYESAHNYKRLVCMCRLSHE